MNEDENEMSETPDQDRYFIKIINHSGAAAVFDSLAGEHAPPVKAYAGQDRLLRATAERDRLESLAASGVDPDTTWKPLPSFVRPEALVDAVRKAEGEHSAALRSLAAEAEVLRRATERLLEVRRRVASLPQTALSATQTAQDAERVLGEALRDPEPQDRPERADRFTRFERGSVTVISPERLKAALQRCTCGASSQLTHDCETAGRIS